MVDVRAATAGDVPAIQRIARESWEAAYGDFVAESTIEELLEEWYSEETVERGVTDDGVVYLVAERGDAVVGYASAGEGEDDGVAILASVYVLPARWGEGVGTALLDAAEERLRERGLDRLRATVLADNDVGVAFYDRRGFERAGEHEEDLGGEQYDALVVERRL